MGIWIIKKVDYEFCKNSCCLFALHFPTAPTNVPDTLMRVYLFATYFKLEIVL